jgi:release factor glutamine methyltransferase
MYGMEPVYLPSEDSYLLSKCVERLVKGIVLDMGTGSGIQAVTAAMQPEVSHVLAVDINPLAIEAAKWRAWDAGVIDKMEFVVSDLFDDVEEVFDWIVFNPPYLPSEGGLQDRTWDGGQGGADVIVRFLDDAMTHLRPGGSILLIVSSETGIELEKYGYKWEVEEEAPLFFETLYCLKLSSS